MAFLSSFDISASALSAQRVRMDIAAENIANIDSTRTEGDLTGRMCSLKASGQDPLKKPSAMLLWARVLQAEMQECVSPEL